jgi:hypothetical protein
MGKLKITESQYNKILLHEQTERNNILAEGHKEVMLVVAVLAGIKLTGQNEFLSQKALNDSSVLSDIKSTLEDEDRLKELVSKMEEKGMESPSLLLSKNAKLIVDKFNELSTDKLDFLSLSNLKELGD